MSAKEFGTMTLIERLGVAVHASQDTEVCEPTGEMVVWHAAPAVISIANDCDRVAATSSTPTMWGGRNRFRRDQQARKEIEAWRRRRVMVLDNHGRPTEMPLIVAVTFVQRDVKIEGLTCKSVSARCHIEGYGEVTVVPLFNVGINYLNENGSSAGTFYGVVYVPKKANHPFRFVPLGSADKGLIQRFNLMVDQARRTESFSKNWHKIIPITNGVGETRVQYMRHSPRYLLKKKYDNSSEQILLDAYYGKIVTLDPSSQLPRQLYGDDTDRLAQEAYDRGEYFYPFGDCLFEVIERENSIVATYMGLTSEVELTDIMAMDLSGLSLQMDPFEVLGQALERYEPNKAKQFVDACLKTDFDMDNPLYRQAVNLQLIPPGLSQAAIATQLMAFGKRALERAKFLWDEAVSITLSSLRRFAPPTIEEILAGNRMDRVLKKLNPDDVAAAWITSHIATPYSHGNLFHRGLREALIVNVAKKAGYTDTPLPAPEPIKAQMPDSSAETGKPSPEGLPETST